MLSEQAVLGMVKSLGDFTDMWGAAPTTSPIELLLIAEILPATHLRLSTAHTETWAGKMHRALQPGHSFFTGIRLTHKLS